MVCSLQFVNNIQTEPLLSGSTMHTHPPLTAAAAVARTAKKRKHSPSEVLAVASNRSIEDYAVTSTRAIMVSFEAGASKSVFFGENPADFNFKSHFGLIFATKPINSMAINPKNELKDATKSENISLYFTRNILNS